MAAKYTKKDDKTLIIETPTEVNIDSLLEEKSFREKRVEEVQANLAYEQEQLDKVNALITEAENLGIVKEK